MKKIFLIGCNRTMSKDVNKQLINELSKMSPEVITTAYSYAVNLIRYGVDVTERWTTATQNASALETAYRKGYYDALQKKQAEKSEPSS